MKKINSLYWRICCPHFAKLAEVPLVLKSLKKKKSEIVGIKSVTKELLLSLPIYYA